MGFPVVALVSPELAVMTEGLADKVCTPCRGGVPS
jgi:hypothetical protein